VVKVWPDARTQSTAELSCDEMQSGP